MCGIYGYAGYEPDEHLLERMASVIRHRGPDDGDSYSGPNVGIGMRRLSIIDVAQGGQPLWNEDRSVVIVFNGEIYNYRELQEQLIARGHKLQTASDTETILHLYEDYGTDCLEHLRGMFGLAIYDLRKRKLFIARDRVGIKPLYYWNHGGKLLFASEIKSLLESPDVSRTPNLAAVDSYLSLRYVAGPQTLFEGINELPAAHWLTVDDHGGVCVRRYWRPTFGHAPYESDDYYQDRFAELFQETVQKHMLSDVPLGAFLSGGVDSTAIVATMSRLSSRPVKTFSVGFDWDGDELPEARESARRLGCDHHEVVCRAEDIRELPNIVWHLDQPIGDAIVLPMHLVSRLARKHVKVVLSGEGGDEILAGYFFHKVMYWAGRYSHYTPRLIDRGLVSPLLRMMPKSLLNLAFSYPAKLGSRGRTKVLDYVQLIRSRQTNREYRFLTSLFDDRDKCDLYSPAMHAHLNAADHDVDVDGSLAPLHQILSLQYKDWLPSNILMKADKISMANSIEGRVPFLDHKLIEFLGQVPPHLKLQGFRDKVLLRNYLQTRLPGKAARRPKKPFYIPLERYFATKEFRELLNTYLGDEEVRRRGLFNPAAVRRLRNSIEAGDFLYAKQVIALVMLEIWFQEFIDRKPVAKNSVAHISKRHFVA